MSYNLSSSVFLCIENHPYTSRTWGKRRESGTCKGQKFPPFLSINVALRFHFFSWTSRHTSRWVQSENLLIFWNLRKLKENRLNQKNTSQASQGMYIPRRNYFRPLESPVPFCPQGIFGRLVRFFDDIHAFDGIQFFVCLLNSLT